MAPSEQIRVGDAAEQPATYSDTCERHGDFEGKILDFPTFGKSIRLGCPVCQEERKAKQAEDDARQAARQREIEAQNAIARLRSAGVPARYDSKTLDAYATTNDGQQKALAAAVRLVTAMRTGREAPNLIMAGTPGTGKTHLACGIIQALHKTHQVRRIDLPDLIREIRATWRRDNERSEEEVLDFYGALDLLILEEVGTGSGSDDERARIFQVINRRYEAMLPTVVVTNLSLSELRTEMGERVIDRLREGERSLVVFDWESARK